MKQFLESTNLLQTIVSETDRVGEDARKLAAELSPEQLNWSPAPNQWSIAQCLEHLAVTSEKFTPYLTDAIARGRARWPVSAPPAYKPTRLGGWLARQIVPEATRKVPAPKVFRPSQSTITGALENFLKQQASFLNLVREADGLDFNKTRLRSPVSPLMRYSLADAFVITVAHSQRHLAQAKRVRETPAFPG